MTRRLFTVGEVNALLPALAAAMDQVTAGTRRLEELSDDIFEEGRPLPDTPVPPEYVVTMLSLQDGVDSIQKMGGEVKDTRQGLVDFRSLKDGREVYLCWVAGEEHVGFWHEMHAGFAGRTAITDHGEFRGEDPS
ncbi:MAG: DUF2203 domain-containing protein [Acidobacteriota bacterium]